MHFILNFIWYWLVDMSWFLLCRLSTIYIYIYIYVLHFSARRSWARRRGILDGLLGGYDTQTHRPLPPHSFHSSSWIFLAIHCRRTFIRLNSGPGRQPRKTSIVQKAARRVRRSLYWWVPDRCKGQTEISRKKIVVTVINACALYSTHGIHTIYEDNSDFDSVVNW